MAKVDCPSCKGEGIQQTRCASVYTCPHCKGFGEIEVSEVELVKAKDEAKVNRRV